MDAVMYGLIPSANSVACEDIEVFENGTACVKRCLEHCRVDERYRDLCAESVKYDDEKCE